MARRIAAHRDGWTCVTNDKALRTTCAAMGVPALWGLEILAMLVEASGLPAPIARVLAKGMHERNRRIGATVLQRFLRRIDLAT